MKLLILIPLLFISTFVWAQKESVRIADVNHYLDSLKVELTTEWPKNRTINIVFHGHSVPSGYFKTPQVNTL